MPAMWALFALFLLPGCGHSLARRSIERLIFQPVCPVCKAIRIEECHCFRGLEGAGYCQTCWSSLDPTYGQMPEQGGGVPVREEEMLLEELPEPTVESVPEAESAPGSSGEHRDGASGAPQPVTQTVVRQAAAVRHRAQRSQAVLFHFADRDPPPADRK